MRPLLLLLALALPLAGCPASSGCETDDAECSDDGTQLRTCTDGSWSDYEDCPEMESCMTMDDGITHCMGSM
jgi:hypothetical protein